jgi:hypothetical protein
MNANFDSETLITLSDVQHRSKTHGLITRRNHLILQGLAQVLLALLVTRAALATLRC